MPQIRPGRVRTKRTNRRTPLLLSAIKPQDVNVREGEVKSIVCPGCQSWRRLMGETKLKIREHCVSDKVADGQKHVRCDGSNQVIVLDISVEQWSEVMLAADSTATGRRSARQFYKPLPGPAAPVARIHAGVTLETARQAYLAHIEACVRCGTGLYCTHGGVLAHRYVLVCNAEPVRREARKQAASAARTAQWNQRGGETVETANNQCRPRPDGTVSEYRGPELPLEPQGVKAYERRQAELAKLYAQHARRIPATSGA